MDSAQHKKFKILLIGDNGVDQYQYGTVDRISPEAPVPILDYTHTITKPGMGANVKDNLEKLGVQVEFIHGLKTSVKTRIIDSKTKHHLLRIDQDTPSRPVKIDYTNINQYDAIVVSDYNKGSITYDTVENLRQRYFGPIFIDTKKTDLYKFEGCYVKINQKEFDAAKTYPSDLIVTKGNKGAIYKDKLIPALNIEAFDVCGAGDTFLSALAYQYCKTKDIIKSIEFAIKASSVTIQHIGVYSPTLEEIEEINDTA
jgi:D-beta-D-heptose 7-phosphate kinase/D-beta-D-heptose 1-phosphate adenosyltransferase